jgi:hypothetical protein
MHTICALQEVSRHYTSEGLVSYHRCRCGRLDVRRGEVAVLSSAGATRSASPTSGRAPTTSAGGLDGGLDGGPRLAVVVVAVLVVALVLVAAIAVPLAALVVGVGLGLFVGGLAGVGAGFVAADRHRGVRVAVSTAAAAVPVVVAGAGLVAALGPVSVIALPVLYAVAGLLWWVGQSRRSAT